MKIYTAIAHSIFKKIKDDIKDFRMLESYFYIKPRIKRAIKENKKVVLKQEPINDFFLDSGAFSAWSKNSIIDIDKYAQFIKDNNNQINIYANLDDITNPNKTWENQLYLESLGLKPLPVYHYGESIDILKRLINKYDYIAFGGMVPISTEKLLPWLNDKFHYICNEKGEPQIKIHGFGMTTKLLIEKFPWFSIDSTSAIIGAGWGRLYTEHGELDLSRNAGVIPLSTQKYIEKFIPEFKFEELYNDYKPRTIYNIRYMQWLEEKLTKNPPRYIDRQGKLF